MQIAQEVCRKFSENPEKITLDKFKLKDATEKQTKIDKTTAVAIQKARAMAAAGLIKPKDNQQPKKKSK